MSSFSFVNVSDTLFYAISKDGNGRAIEVNNTLIEHLGVKNSFFISLSALDYGGAIFSNVVQSHIECSSFLSYFCRHYEDNFFGNGVYIKNPKLEENKEISTFYSNTFINCGPNTNCGDSAVSCQNIAEVDCQNSTSNYGTGGCSGFSCRSHLDVSIIKYLNTVDAHDYYAI